MKSKSKGIMGWFSKSSSKPVEEDAAFAEFSFAKEGKEGGDDVSSP